MSEWKEYKLGEIYEFASGLSSLDNKIDLLHSKTKLSKLWRKRFSEK